MNGKLTHKLRSTANDRRLSRRSGFSTLWQLLILPCIVVLLCLVIEIFNLWMARAELEDALEAAALAAVKEWGDANGGDTFVPRNIGVDYAATNTVRGLSVFVDNNYDPAGSNDNDQCITLTDIPPLPPVLIFGAITDDDTPHTFDTTVMPSCLSGWPVLFDVSSNSSLQQDDAWGINFKPRDSATVPDPTLNISQIVIDLLPPGNGNTGDPAYFDFFDVEPPNGTIILANLTDAPVISNNSGPVISTPDCAATQDDVFGLDDSPLLPFNLGGGLFSFSNSQITFLFNVNDPAKLIIRFNDTLVDSGFVPGDRFRFGAKVEELENRDIKPANSANDGDDVGRVGAQVSVTFALGPNDLAPAATATFIDSRFGANNGPDVPADIDCMVVSNFPYVLPGAPASGNNNDDQSYVELVASGDGGDPFAVHAVGTIQVPTVCLNLFGLMGSSFPVAARATAMYDCKEHSPQLIRIDELICP